MRKNSTKKTAAKRTGKKEPTAHASAIAVMEFLNSAAPDFLTSIVMETIERACEHLDPHPFYPTYEPGQEDHDKILLTALAKRTKLLSLRDLEESKASLARHVAAIYRHPLTPTRLYNDIGNFVTDGANLKVSACELDTSATDDITLAEEWTWQPQTIERIIELANKYDGAETAEAAN